MENEKDEPMINLKKREGQLLRMVEKVMDQPGEQRERGEREAPGITRHGQDMMWNPRGGGRAKEEGLTTFARCIENWMRRKEEI